MWNVIRKAGILPWVILAIIAGIVLGLILPSGIIRIFVTFNSIFGQFLGFAVALIIVGLVTPAIADLGKGAGKWLTITTAIAYASTLFAGFITLLVCELSFPYLLAGQKLDGITTTDGLSGYFEIKIPPIMDVVTALLISFVIGIGLSLVPRGVIRKGFVEFREIIASLIDKIIIPLLPVHILGIFMNITKSNQVGPVILVLLKVVVVVLVLEVIILLVQYGVAGLIAHRNPIRALIQMLPAYLTALGTSSSAATIPVTLRQTRANGISEPVANFTIPLCATIHIAGSTSKITAFALAIIMINGLPVHLYTLIGFIFLLGVTMVAAPGVPGGAIMASTGILASTLGFNETNIALMIATYIALDSFGTATNVTGDCAIAMIIDRLAGSQIVSENESVKGFSARASFDAKSYLGHVREE